MKKHTHPWILLVALAAACGDAPTAPPEEPAAPLPDAGLDAGHDALVTPDAGGYQGEAGPDSRPPSSEPDAGPEAAPDAAAPEASPDVAPPTVDAAAADVDAGTSRDADAGPTAICSSPDPSCKVAIDADAAIQAAFPPSRYACAEGTRKCGTLVQQGITMTYPMICRAGAWRLAGAEVSGRWVAAYTCSMACGVGKVCDP